MRMLLAVVLLALAGAVEAQVSITVGPQGQYLANPSANRLDPDSMSNPLGRLGPPLGSDSINNPMMGRWGSPSNPYSVTNPYPTRGPRVVQPYQPMMPPGW
jgi:hypothetical protein